MSNRSCQFNMAHALTAHLGQCHFNAALLTDDAFILHPLIFAAKTFIIFHRTKNPSTKKTITLRLKCSIVNRLWLFDLAKRPRMNFFRARNRNPNLIECGLRRLRIKEIDGVVVHPGSPFRKSCLFQSCVITILIGRIN